MWNRRYPHVSAGKLASLPFGATALLGGWIVADLIPKAPPAVFSAILWAVMGAGVAYLVFAAEGVTRPPSLMQASIADGLVAGIITASFGTAIVAFAAGGAGGAGQTVSGWGIVGAIAIGLGVGAAIGALLGTAVALIGSQDALARIPPGRRRKRRGP